ncbi:MAG: hypothetical protein ACKV2O_17135 [Acidimicrobiales bacterium]
MSPSPLADLSAGLLAHEGGWDEIGLVAIPLLVVAALLVMANRRAKRVLAQRQTELSETPQTESAAGDPDPDPDPDSDPLSAPQPSEPRTTPPASRSN